MPSIIPLGFIYTSQMTARLLTKYKDSESAPFCPSTQDLKEWPSARRVVTQLRAAGLGVNGGHLPSDGAVVIETYVHGERAHWLSKSNLELFVPLICGPGAMIYAGTDCWAPIVGMAFAIAPDCYRSVFNHGTNRLSILRIHVESSGHEVDKSEEPAGPELES